MMKLMRLQYEMLNHIKDTDKSLAITATANFGLQRVFSEFLNHFEGTKMIISKRMLLQGCYKRENLDDSIIMKTPQKLLREDISVYTPDLLVVEWPKTNTNYTVSEKVIDEVANQSKRVIFKFSTYDPRIKIRDFKKVFYVSPDFSIMYAIKEL